jgi:hypothetical protein
MHVVASLVSFECDSLCTMSAAPDMQYAWSRCAGYLLSLVVIRGGA